MYKETCKRGHKWIEENIMIKGGKKRCKPCQKRFQIKMPGKVIKKLMRFKKMTRLTLEREQEIREYVKSMKNAVGAQFMVEETLEEIDALRADYFQILNISNFHANECDQLKAENDWLRKETKIDKEENQKLRARVAALREDVNVKLRSIMVGNYSYLVDSYCGQIDAVFLKDLAQDDKELV